MLLAGEADIGIATEALEEETELASFPYYSWHHGGHRARAGMPDTKKFAR